MFCKLVLLIIAICFGYSLYDNFDPGVLEGKRVLITGASRGIGEQIAYHYAKMGAKVLITARSEAKLQKVVAKCHEIGKNSGEYHYIAADMGDMSSTEKVVQAAIDKFGGLDILVLNHIVDTALGPWLSHPQNLTKAETIIDINFKSFMHLASHALPYLMKSHGSLVVVSSVAGRVPLPFMAAYSASKHALHGFFGALREEFHIRKNDVSITECTIGSIATDNYVGLMQEAGLQRMLDYVNMAKPEDAAFAIVRGGALKETTTYFPPLTARLVTALHNVSPGLIRLYSTYLFDSMRGN